MGMELVERIDMNDPDLHNKLARRAEQKCEMEIQAVLEKYTCELVFDEIRRNGQFIQGAFKAAYIKGEDAVKDGD